MIPVLRKIDALVLNALSQVGLGKPGLPVAKWAEWLKLAEIVLNVA